MSSHIQFKRELEAGIPPADAIGQGRLYWRSSDGIFYIRDENGADTPIAGGFVSWVQANGGSIVTGATYTMLVTFETVRVDPTIQPVTINIVTAVGFAGYQCKVKNVTTDVTPISVTPFAGESIEGGASDAPWVMNTPREFVVLESDGAGWMVVG